LPLLRKVHGTAAFVSSVHSVLPTPDFAVYTATKAALDGFARNLRIELRGDVDVLLLWPGPTRTGMHAKSGMPAASIHPARQMAVEVAAERMARAIARRQSATLRRGDGLLRRLAKHFESPIDAALAAQRRRAA
jgi:short-subunit dehydrogenase